MTFATTLWLLAATFTAHAQTTDDAPAEEAPAEEAPAEEAPAEEAPTDADADAKARQLYQNGARLYEEARYEQAIVAFREAYAVSKRHELLKNIANAQERLGQLQAAVDSLNEYRVYASADEQGSLTTRIRVLEERVFQEREAKRQADEAARAAALAAATTAPAGPTEQPVRTAPNTAKWALLGAGGALGAGFGVATYLTYDAGQNAIDAGDRARYDASRTLNNVFGGAAVVGAGLAVVALAMPTTRVLSVSASPRSIHLQGRF